jgi:hypothetical protein
MRQKIVMCFTELRETKMFENHCFRYMAVEYK